MDNIIDKDITIELSNGIKLEVYIDIGFYTERGYGADIDGNRGYDTTMIDYCNIHFYDNKDKLLTPEEKKEADILIDKEIQLMLYFFYFFT